MKELVVLGVDPGPTWMGWCMLDIRYDPGIRTTFVTGGHAPCDYEAFRHVLTEAQVIANNASKELAMAVERPRGYAFQPARVPMLLDTANAAGGMVWLARARGLRFVELTAQQVRKHLAGKATADDDAVKVMVERNVFGAATARNDHVRDAIAVGLLGGWSLVGQVILEEVQRGTKRQGRKPAGAAGEQRGGGRGRRAARKSADA